MNWGKLKRTLERDFKKNPAKTGVLLALLPVAAYFIGPLLWKMLPKKSGEPVAGGTVALAPAGIVNPTMPATASTGSTKWSEIANQIAQDHRMTSVALGGLRNPFENDDAVTIDLAQDSPKKAEPVEQEADLRPEDLGLQLTATIVGSRVKLATINGKQYRENAKLPILQSSDRPQAEQNEAGFIVKTVAQKYVVLEREGRLYQLQMSR